MNNKIQHTKISKWHVLLTCCFAMLCLLFNNKANAQASSPCDTASPFCTGDTTTYTNTTGQPPTPGINFGCLGTAPNPAWYFMQIGVSGPMQFTISQVNNAGTPIDVDFAMWGPYPSLTAACAPITSGAMPIQCSYSAAAVELAGLGMPGGTGTGATTPPAPVVGQIYVIMMTNFSNQPGTVTFNQTSGTGETDCSIICGLNTSNSGPVCQGDPVTLYASNNTDSIQSFTYLWTGPGGFTSTLKEPSVIINSPGTYTFNVRTISDSDDTCNKETEVVVLATHLMPTDVSICSGETYNWFGKEYYIAGTYDSTFTNANGCDSIVRLNLIVNPLPAVALKGPKALGICEGSSTKLTLTGNESNVTYQWMRDGYAVSGETKYYIDASLAGKYTVVATTDKGCSKTSSVISLTVNPNPEAKIQPLSNEIICAYDTMEVTAGQGTNYEYRWSPEKPFRILTGADMQKVKGVFIDPATEVVLKVFNEFGCYDSDTAIVQTKPCCEVFIPSAFSPNGDTRNDYFKPNLQPGQILLNCKIFDRFGKMVYNNDNIKLGWNGNYPDGTLAPNAVYMYYIKYTCADGKLYEKKESITLIR